MGAFETTTVNNFSGLGQNNQQFKALNVPDTTEDLLFSGYHQFADGTTNDYNWQFGFGKHQRCWCTNNSMDDGDNLRIDFVTRCNGDGWQQQHYNYTTHYDAQNFQFTIVQVNGSPPPDSIRSLGAGL